MSSSVLFFFVLWISMMRYPALVEGLCRRLKFSPTVDGYALKGHVIKTISLNIHFVENIPSRCKNYCTMESKCVSFNIGPPIKDNVLCQLNDADHIQYPKDLQAKEGFMYRGTENSCSSNPCLNNATCLNGFTATGYSCECQDSYSGDQCERDIDECVSGLHDCHSSASCTNTVGSYKCSCDQPYIGDGKMCKMTPECQNYKSLTGGERKVTFPTVKYKCDSSLSPNWYRIQGSAGTKMPTACPKTRRCNTAQTGWLSGGHPKVAQGKVIRKVCFHWNSNCCNLHTNIHVRNCGSFYVYYLSGTPGCNLRYCSIN